MEHRAPKSRYTRTSRKSFVKQMAQIERRQARLRNMRSTLTSSAALSVAQPDVVALDPQSHHNIGKSENEPEHIGTFLNTNRGDPAIVVRFLHMFSLFVYFQFANMTSIELSAKTESTPASQSKSCFGQ